MQITPQATQYGLPDKEARELPSAAEMSEFLGGPRIMSGLMRRSHLDDETAFDC